MGIENSVSLTMAYHHIYTSNTRFYIWVTKWLQGYFKQKEMGVFLITGKGSSEWQHAFKKRLRLRFFPVQVFCLHTKHSFIKWDIWQWPSSPSWCFGKKFKRERLTVVYPILNYERMHVVFSFNFVMFLGVDMFLKQILMKEISSKVECSQDG